MPSWKVASCFRPFKSVSDTAYHKNKETSHVDSSCERSSILIESKKNSSVVELVKIDGNTLGIIISGGVDQATKPKISSLRPGSVADRSDCLAVGDNILSVNEIQTSKLKHDEIVALLKNSGDKISLEIEYEIPLSSTEGSMYVCPKIIQLQLEKDDDSFGFTLRGGVCSNKLKNSLLTITHVRFGGPAFREGSIKAGDRLLAVDGINLTGATLQEALSILKQSGGIAIFTIEYDVSVIDAVKHASGPLLVEIDKDSGTNLGINLTCLHLGEPAIVIESIRQASIAERCGALHVGDHVLAIDDTKIDLMTSAEAMQLLCSPAETINLEIFPISQMIPRRVPEIYVSKGGTIPHYMAARASFTNSCNTLSSLGSFSLGSITQFASVTPHSMKASLVTPVSATCSPIGHTDRLEVILPSSHTGFGFTIQSQSYSSNVLTTPPFICSIENESSAEKSGVLQVGDRILAVNGKYVDGLTLEETTQLIAHSHPKLLLKTEFNIAEAVVPNSGTFLVKLIKRGASGLGISVTAQKKRQMSDPLIISTVEKGSVAHRSGTIQPGDKLLAIDLMRMENCSVEDATTILNSCSDIVTLRIRKDETFSDDPDVTSAIIYTVELTRHGGPLGITVSGAEEPFVPITISGLTEKGLAERTGALHVGDKILAINGSCLRGKTLSEAIQILQSCGDNVTLKISRLPLTSKLWDRGSPMKWPYHTVGNNLKTYVTPIPSEDSALESWDSCNFELCNGDKIDCKFEECSVKKTSVVLLNSCDCLSDGQSNHHCSPHLWENRSLSAISSHSFSGSQSLPSEDSKDNWSKVLEDLQTCGQSELLRQIECKILGSDDNVELQDSPLPPYCTSDENVSKCPSDTFSEQSLQDLSVQIAQLKSGLNKREYQDPVSDITFSTPSCNQCAEHRTLDKDNHHCTEHNSSLTFPQPIEVHKVILFKDQVYEDFGFSVSDGLYEHGVYINRIRTGGPADVSGLIKPYDRILQVNTVKTYDHDCCLTVPLIAASGDRIELVVSRPEYDNDSSEENNFERLCDYGSWTGIANCERSLSPTLQCSRAQTLTKML